MPRVAGIFEAPPAMLKSFLGWAVPLYAGHVLAQTEARLQLLRNQEQIYLDAVKEMERTQRNLEHIVDALEVGGEFTFHTYRVLPSGKLYSFIHGAQRRLDGIPDSTGKPVRFYAVGKGRKRLKYPRWSNNTRKNALYYLRGDLQSGLAFMEAGITQFRERGDDPGSALVDNILLRRECLKHTSKAKEYATKTKRKLPVNLSGWRYAQATAKELAAIEYKNITVILDFKGHSTRGGIWRPGQKELQVDVLHPIPLTVAEFRVGLESIQEVARHELQHVGQFLLKELRGLGEIGGIPGASVRDTSRDVYGFPADPKYVRRQDEHELRDVEFYTDLADEVPNFMRAIRKVSPEDQQVAFRTWTGLQKWERTMSPKVGESTFFRRLHTWNKAKWVRAVGEFLKAVEKKGYRAPSAFRVASRHVASYFSIGDHVLFGKYKNKKGKVIAAYLDEKGHPVVEIEPVPKGRKQNKIVQLYRIWHAPASPKMANQDWSRPSAVRVAQARDEGSKDFFDNPMRSSVRDFALSNAITNEPAVAQQSLDDGLITETEEERVDDAPLTPSESVQEPGGKEFSTLAQYLIETDTPTVEPVSQGFADIPKSKNLAEEG